YAVLVVTRCDAGISEPSSVHSDAGRDRNGCAGEQRHCDTQGYRPRASIGAPMLREHRGLGGVPMPVEIGQPP
ncbi:MAG TPA: hypothetical protein VFI46_12075, partial [Jiangellaceae bacterium]|nr:hypothetical protein [Jiangellaceae bacterium]